MDLLPWILTTLVGICLALVGAIWKSTKAEVSWMRDAIEALQSGQSVHTGEINKIQTHCAERDKVRINETTLRALLREELDRFKEEITDTIKLRFLEEGLIKMQPTKQRPRKPPQNAKKN
jgi:hypothetical protein